VTIEHLADRGALAQRGGMDRTAGLRGFAERADLALKWVTEIPAAILVVVEAVILFTNVIARYVFHSPLLWADELAAILFLWLAMLGAVIALRRGEHMRLTSFVALMSPQRRAWFEALSGIIIAVFAIWVMPWVHEHVANDLLITLPALGISNIFRIGALEVGFALMLCVALVRLVRECTARQVLEAALLVGAIGLVLTFSAPFLKGLGNGSLIVFFVLGVGACVVAGVPIAFAFAIATMAYIALMTYAPLSVVVSRMDEGMSHMVLLSVPLFVVLGVLLEMSGMARAMVAFLASLLGHVRGGLSYVLIGAMYVVSGISGSKAADMAAVAPALFPEMKERGANNGELVALLSTSAAMSETIPPSLVLITVGSVTGVSIAALFTGGLVPALVLALALCFVIWLRNRKEVSAQVERAPLRTILMTFLFALPALALPFLIRAAVIEGVATATEVSALGIVYIVLVGIIFYRTFEWRRVYPMLVRTASLTGAILFIIGAATAMAWGLAQSGFSRDLVAMMSGLPGGTFTFMIVSIIAFIVLGSVLEGIPALVLFGPLLFPAAKALGIHEVHYAMVVILAMGIGLFAPPIGVGYYTACAIGDVSPDEGMKAIWPYMLALVLGLLVVAAVPWFSIGFL
jgi:tripartite ATP-independent transporter DctM subunit